MSFTLHRGTSPLLVSMPHIGTDIFDDLKMVAAALAGCRTLHGR